MHLEKRLPRNGKEGFLYGSIIATLTVLLMVSYSIILNTGEFNGSVALMILKAFPIIWIIVMVIEQAIISRIAEALTANFTQPADSFTVKILFRILFTVFGMSIIMTFIGELIGNGFHPALFSNWLHNWPRNFMIVLLAESLVIQPIARFAMVKLHEAQDRKAGISAETEVPIKTEAR